MAERSSHAVVDLASESAEPTQLKLLIAIPALNEERTIGAVVSRIPPVIPGVGSTEVLVVDDGSKDATGIEASAAGARIIRHPTSAGVGSAFHSALAYGIDAGADLIVTLDADGQFDPVDIPLLIEPIVRERADFVTASRFKDPNLVPKMPRLKIWGNRLMSFLVSRIAGQRFYDVSCGMRCYSRRAALHLHLLGRFTYTQEVFINLAFKRLTILEVPIEVRGEREFGRSRVAGNLGRYGVLALLIILRSYRDYRPLRFFGSLAGGLFVGSFLLGTFFLFHYLEAGTFRPHTWAGVSAGALFCLAVMVMQMGVIGDMLTRHRVYLEEILHRQRQAGSADRFDPSHKSNRS